MYACKSVADPGFGGRGSVICTKCPGEENVNQIMHRCLQRHSKIRIYLFIILCVNSGMGSAPRQPQDPPLHIMLHL